LQITALQIPKRFSKPNKSWGQALPIWEHIFRCGAEGSLFTRFFEPTGKTHA
jgi:hypothetical protein